MKIQFVGQASVIISTSDSTILCDPWLFGTAFNDSWRLFPDPCWSEANYAKITHLWISHEHPDHFHFPTLKSMPKEFKERVVVLFQRNNSEKIPCALKQLGFKNVVLLTHRKKISLTGKTTVYNHQVGQMDSALAVIGEGYTVLNLNDCEANSSDCRLFKKDLGKVDVVINQFSMAGYGGKIDYSAHLPGTAESIVKNMLNNHRDLGADLSIPFASNIYFCCNDNKHINDFANTPRTVYEAFQKANLKLEVLYVGDVYDLARGESNTAQALLKYDALYQTRKDLKYYGGDIVRIEKLEEAFKIRFKQLAEKYPKLILSRLRPMVVSVPDIRAAIRFSLYTGEFTLLGDDADYDLIINSQPLHFAWMHTWGVQTLGVSGRWLIKSNEKVWFWYRVISSMNNAEFYLKPRYLLTATNARFVLGRMRGSLNQLAYQIKRMRT